MIGDFKVVIDKLKLCYKRDNDSRFWQMMAEKPEQFQIGDFDFVRCQADGMYDGVYDVLYNEQKLSTLLFDRFSDKDKKFCWLSIQNRVFYSKDMSIKTILLLQDVTELGNINNITKLDLACDLQFNPVPRIKKLLKRDDVSVVRCGTKIVDKKQEIEGLIFIHPTNGLKELAPSLYFSDMDKRKSLVVYDKNKEIRRTDKTYIADFYGNPRYLYRLEIRLTSDEIFRYFKKYDVSPSVDMLINQDYLKSMYDELLFRMLHFTYKRKTICLLDAVTMIKNGYDLDVLI